MKNMKQTAIASFAVMAALVATVNVASAAERADGPAPRPEKKGTCVYIDFAGDTVYIPNVTLKECIRRAGPQQEIIQWGEL